MEEQIRIEYEISQLKSNSYNIEVESVRVKKEYQIEIIIPQALIDPSIYQGSISFVLIIKSDKYPYSAPYLFCTSQFCFPHFSDGRDILEAVMGEKWSEQSKLISLLPLIPQFIEDYFKKSDMIYVGKYYLGERYDLKILEKANFEIKHIKENVVINGKWTKFPRLLLISDVYFLLFEQEKWSKNKLKLVFWASINSILIIRKILVNKMLFINWRQKGTNDPFEMCLSIDKGEEIVEKLLERMQYFGINYNVTKEVKGLPPKEVENKESNIEENTGTTNATVTEDFNIQRIEEDIVKHEALKNSGQSNENIDLMLSNLYYSAEKFYEIKGSDKAEYYKKKREELNVKK